MSTLTTASIYWLHLSEHTDYNTQGYIGVSQNPDKRWSDHLKEISNKTHKNSHLIHAVKKYGWESIIKEILVVGTEAYCYDLEKTLRPTSKIGWNISPGGHHGPGWVKGRKKDPLSIEKYKLTMAPRYQEIRERKLEQTLLKKQLKLKAKEKRLADIESEKQLKLKAKEKRLADIESEKQLKRETQLSNANKMLVATTTVRPLCKTCGSRPVAINYRKEGRTFYRRKCDHCAKGRSTGRPLWALSGYRMKLKCDRCAYESKYKDQFNVYYIDGSPSNCKLTNLKTVCANCQRILHVLKLPWRRGDLTPDF